MGADIRKLILDEPTHILDELPRGTCRGGQMKKRSYTFLDDSLFTCNPDASPATNEPVTDAPSEEATSAPSDPVTQSPSVVEDFDESFASQICVSMLLFFVLLFKQHIFKT